MFKVIEIIDEGATRVVKLGNMETGAIEWCFDDSALISEKNFEFMQIGRQYDCKIKLFGKPVFEKTARSVTCRVRCTEVPIGEKAMVEVETAAGKYYIPRSKVAKCSEDLCFEFSFSRKDLIQVDETIHADFLVK